MLPLVDKPMIQYGVENGGHIRIVTDIDCWSRPRTSRRHRRGSHRPQEPRHRSGQGARGHRDAPDRAAASHPRARGLKREQNTSGDEIARAKRQGKDTGPIQEANRARAQQIKQLGFQVDSVDHQLSVAVLQLPNLPHSSVPVGKSAADNVEVRRVGEPREFDFVPTAHWDLGPALGILDFERATKIAGARFSVLSGAGARLSRALINFMLERAHPRPAIARSSRRSSPTARRCRAPASCRSSSRTCSRSPATGISISIPTAEVPLTNLHRGEILDGRELPIRYTAYTPCFRSEAGSYGQDVRGLIRQHQFDKVELVKLTTPEQSYDELESLTADAEDILKRLELPYRTMLLCTGDMGFAAAKTYDIEVWLPSQKTYREISSCSNTEAFQARRANIKFRGGGTGQGGLRAHAERLRAGGRTHADRDPGELSAEGRIGRHPRRAAPATWAAASASRRRNNRFVRRAWP